TVVGKYQGGSGHQSKYTYNFTASYAGCQNLPLKAYLNVDEPLTGAVTANDPICENTTAKMDASSYEATSYEWMKEDSTGLMSGSNVSVKLAETTKFLLHMTRGKCKADTIYEAQVTSNPQIERVDSVGIRDRKILVYGDKGTTPFQYSVDNGTLEDDATMENLKFTVHLAYVKDANGCTDTMTFYMAPPMVTIPDFFTPNGDGINDQWIPSNLKEVYSDAKVTIFDRFGKKLAEYRASDPDWDGTYNNKPMPSTDYWYEIDIEEIDKQYVGHFTLLRQ
ncbi:MAG: T9SS type B sorting domain-containing protein, partial [Paludibacteraceae bacterium]